MQRNRTLSAITPCHQLGIVLRLARRIKAQTTAVIREPQEDNSRCWWWYFNSRFLILNQLELSFFFCVCLSSVSVNFVCVRICTCLMDLHCFFSRRTLWSRLCEHREHTCPFLQCMLGHLVGGRGEENAVFPKHREKMLLSISVTAWPTWQKSRRNRQLWATLLSTRDHECFGVKQPSAPAGRTVFMQPHLHHLQGCNKTLKKREKYKRCGDVTLVCIDYMI